MASTIPLGVATSAYQAVVEPSWQTTTSVPVAMKLPDAFQVIYTMPAPDGARVDWLVVSP